MSKIFDSIMQFLVRWLFNPAVYFVFGVLLRWRIIGKLPDVPKMMFAFAPHTAGSDFFYIVYIAAYFGVRPNWIGKKELFEGFWGRFSYYTGGIPVDREAPLKALKQVIKFVRKEEKVYLCIAPEGTRHYSDGWKKGFYFIAQKTNMPIIYVKIDYPNRTVTIREAFTPTGDAEADILVAQEFFADAVGRNPENAAPVKFEDEV